MSDNDEANGSPKREGTSMLPEAPLTPPAFADSPSVLSDLSPPPVPKVQSSGYLFGEDIGESSRDLEDNDTYSDDEPDVTSLPLHPFSDQNGEESANASVHSNPFPPKVPGRPPRAPTNAHGNLPFRNTSDTQERHRRGNSAGEISFMSALTDVSDDDSLARRDRTVSWDEHLFGGGDKSVSNSSIIQPVLEEIGSSPPRTKQVNEKFTMAEVVNPMESEAETHILRSLEQRDKSTRKMLGTASIFPNLSDDATESFRNHILSPATSVDHGSSHDEKTPMTPTTPTSGAGCRVSVSSRQSSSRRLRGHRRTNTSVSKQSLGDEAGAGVDTTLFGLATVMRNIHLEANKEHPDIVNDEHIDEHRNATTGIGHPVSSFKEQPRTETDQLVAHAAHLFRRNVKKRDKESVSSFGSDGNTAKQDNTTGEGGNENDTDQELDIEVGVDVDDFDSKKGRKFRWGRGYRKGKRKDQLDSKSRHAYQRAVGTAREDWERFNDFLGVRKQSAITYAKNVMVFLFLPVLGIAALLYYALGNPPAIEGASISWFLLFLGIRQIITFTFAKITELLIIDFLALKTRLLLRVLGPWLTLMIVQSKGWPCTLFWWALYDLFMLSGPYEFPNHWMFYQNWIGLFNADNPSGNITDHAWNYRILIAALLIGMLVSIKRFVVGLYLGGRTYTNYGTKLACVILKMIIISQVAGLARTLKTDEDPNKNTSGYKRHETYKWDFRGFGDDVVLPEDDDDLDGRLRQRLLSTDETKDENGDGMVDANTQNRNPFTQSLSATERFRITELLGRWEEPQEEQSMGKVSIQAILQFKQTLAFMDLTYPFSAAFGLADSRESCVESAQNVFGCLLKGNPPSLLLGDQSILKFETLAELARNEIAGMDESRLKDLVRVFRPDRNGNLSMIDFVRSIDQVYKELRLLRASIHNSSQLDRAFEAIINVGFYFIVFCVTLAAWGIDPLALFLSLSSVIVAFSFAVGAASAKYFEGLMFILGRTPYDIGDRISINQADEPPKTDGEATWFVENVSLYYTTLRFGATNEVATIANSNLANSRVINAARSPRALVYVNLKFGIDTPYVKTQVFKDTMESFVKQRPREWLNCSGIRATRVMADLGYIEYVIILQHRESWQQIGVILQSKAEIMNYSLEVQKKLGIKYEQPSTPVDLTVNNPGTLRNLMMPSAGGDLMSPSPDRSASERARHGRIASQDLRNIAAMFTPQGAAST